jgi:hypothetical protein
MLVILGGLLAGGAGAFTGLLIAYNTSGGPKYNPEIFGQSLPTLSTLGVFCSGMTLGLTFCLGLWLIVGVHRTAMLHTTGSQHTPARTQPATTPGTRRPANKPLSRSSSDR